MYLILLFLSILPIYLLGNYIYKNDFDKEPTKLIFKLFFLGVGSTFVTIFISNILDSMFPLLGADPTNLDPIGLIPYTFIGVALVEEFSKWIFVYFDTYKRKEFNHAYDAIVYSVFVALGFACFENILYVFSTYEIQTAIMRALLAVPGHACDGVLMGYFLALAKISEKHNNLALSKKNKILSLIAPAVAHGIYDYLLFATPSIAAFSLVFFIFIFWLFKKSLSIVKQMKDLKFDLSPNLPFDYTNFINSNNNTVRVDYNQNSNLFNGVNTNNAYKPLNYCVVCGSKADGAYCQNCGRKQIY